MSNDEGFFDDDEQESQGQSKKEKKAIEKRTPNHQLQKLTEPVLRVIRYYHDNQNIKNLTVKMLVCVYKHKIYTSRCIVTGISMKTNEEIKLNKGVNPLIIYTLAKWRFDHVRAEKIKWNVIRFTAVQPNEFDTSSTAQAGFSTQEIFDEGLESRALSDAKDGIITKAGRKLFTWMNRGLIGSRKVKSKNEEEYRADDEMRNDPNGQYERAHRNNYHHASNSDDNRSMGSFFKEVN